METIKRIKYTRTWKELRDSVVNDTPLKGMKTNPIDDIIALDKWKKGHNKK